MILALHAAGPTTLIWFFERPEDIQHLPEPYIWQSGRDLSFELLGKITTLARQRDRDIGNFTGIVVFSGPGSFTSLRIGHTVANALADSLEIPVVGALGDDWLSDGVSRLETAPIGQPVMPFYGAEPNITQAKK